MQKALPLPQTDHGDYIHSCPNHPMVVHQDAFRAPGGAGGVQDLRVVRLLDRHFGGIAALRLHRGGQIRSIRSIRSVGRGRQAHPANLRVGHGERLVHDAAQIRIVQNPSRAAVLQLKGQFWRRQCDSIAAYDSQTRDRMRGLIDRPIKDRIRVARRPVHQSVSLSLARAARCVPVLHRCWASEHAPP